MQFLLRCLQPNAVLMLFVAASCLLGYAYPGYRDRANAGLLWLLWLFIGVLAAIAWLILVAS